jgi:hypothetical protein
MTHRLGVLFLMIGILCGGVRAHETRAPVVMLINGDFWAWDEGSPNLRQLTNWRYNREFFSLSPDGTRLAYVAWSPLSVDAFLQGHAGGSGELPGDIWVLDVQTGGATPLIEQPRGAALPVDNASGTAWKRGKPVWSPDSAQIAWAEYLYPAGRNQLRRYDFATRTTHTVATDLPAQANPTELMEVMWGKGFIAARSITPDASNRPYFDDETLLVYTPDGQPLARIPLADQHESYTVSLYRLIDAGSRQFIGVLFENQDWVLFDPQTGQSYMPSINPQPYNLLRPQQPPVLAFVLGSAVKMNQLQFLNPDGSRAAQLEIGYDEAFDHFSLSPDGQAVAYRKLITGAGNAGRAVRVWRNGQSIIVPGTDQQYVFEFVWGPTGWRTPAIPEYVAATTRPPTLTPDITPFTCPGALAPRLMVGGKGFVLAGEPNNIRALPSRQAQIIQTIPAGGVFTVLEGPRCGDGIVWCQVSYTSKGHKLRLVQALKT